MKQVQILWVGRSFTDITGGVKPHTHPYYHMFCTCSGELSMTADGQSYRLQAGTGILIPTGVEHSYVNTGDHTAEYLEIKFTLPSAPLDAQLSRLDNFVFSDPAAILLAERIVQEYSDMGSLADEAAAGYLLALLHLLTREQRCQKHQRFRYIDAAEYSPLSQQIIRYLENHYAENVTLDELAAILDRSKSHLCITFKKDTRSTIVDCLNLIRIRRAAELITYSDYSLAQVSTMCGFSSVSHFNRVFLKYAGITPGQCRRAYPADVLLNPTRFREIAETHQANRFLYSVLAQRRISLDAARGKESSAGGVTAGSDDHGA